MGIDVTQWRIEIARYWKFAGRTRHSRGKSPGVKAASATICNPLLALLLSFCLITAPSLLLQAGDVERNPGPPKRIKLRSDAASSPQPPKRIKLQSKLTINDLGDVYEEIYEARTKAYNIGIKLRLSADTLESIPIHPDKQLWGVLTAWLRNAENPTWQDIVEALRSKTVGHSKLARDIEAKRCATAKTGQASGQTMPTLDTQLQTLQSLQQALQESQELRIRDQQDSERRICTLRRKSQRQIEKLKQQVHEKQCMIDEREKLLKATDQDTLQREYITGEYPTVLHQKAPEKMRRGSAASDSNTAYFNSYGSTTVYSYDIDTQEWNRLPCTPHTHFTLVVVQHKLTMVGGAILGKATNDLFSLMRNKRWLRHFLPMPTPRYLTAVVYSGHSLIVAGGVCGGRTIPVQVLTTVEVLDTGTQQWSAACPLPQPFALATISICGERLYMLGGFTETSRTCSALSCSIPKLLLSCQLEPLPSTVWRQVADVPYFYSSCATLCGQLIAVGGYHEIYGNIKVIIAYNEETNSWEYMTDIPTARRWALVAILKGKIMVVGGEDSRSYGNELDVVEIL